MTITTPVSTRREPELDDKAIVVIGGSAGIGLMARPEGHLVQLDQASWDHVIEQHIEILGPRRLRSGVYRSPRRSAEP
jgi:hypothetical protein